MKYAGIGSRNTPDQQRCRMADIAAGLAKQGWLLRSGAAPGADTAFEWGCDQVNGDKEIYLPWSNFARHSSSMTITPEQLEAAEYLASLFHPAWDKCSPAARQLHARNGFQILGPDLNDPVDMVICWTPGGKVTGGTGQAMRIAQHLKIPILNLAMLSDNAFMETYERLVVKPMLENRG